MSSKFACKSVVCPLFLKLFLAKLKIILQSWYLRIFKIKFPIFYHECYYKSSRSRFSKIDIAQQYEISIRDANIFFFLALLSSRRINRAKNDSERDFNPFPISLFTKCGIIPSMRDCPCSLLAETPGSCLNKTHIGRSCQKCALRSSVVFPDFCVPQVMRARDLPHAYTLSLSLFLSLVGCCWSFRCPQGTLSRSGHCELRGSRSSGEAWES